MEKISNYDWLHCIPQGWEELARRMIAECEAIDSTYTIDDLKEKFGSMCVYSHCQSWYDNDNEINDCGRAIGNIEDKYETLSARTCCACGHPATKISTGWICPYCDNCGDKDEKFYKRFK